MFFKNLNIFFGTCYYEEGALIFPTFCHETEMAKVATCFSLLLLLRYEAKQTTQNLVNITLYYAELLFGGLDPSNLWFSFVPR